MRRTSTDPALGSPMFSPNTTAAVSAIAPQALAAVRLKAGRPAGAETVYSEDLKRIPKNGARHH